MMNKRMFVFLVLVFCAIVQVGSATDYYVSPSGDNAANGLSDSTPWQTLSFASGNLTAGDTLYIMTGTYEDDPIVSPNDGTEENPILIKKYSGDVLLNGTYAPGYIAVDVEDWTTIDGISTHGWYNAIDFDTANYSTAINLSINHTDGAAVLLSNSESRNNSIQYSDIQDSGWNAIQIHAAHNSLLETHNCSVIGVTVHDTTAHACIDLFGIVINPLIQDCEFYNYSSGGIFSHDPDSGVSTAQQDRVEGLRIINCTAHDANSYGFTMARFKDMYIDGYHIYNINKSDGLQTRPVDVWDEIGDSFLQNNTYADLVIDGNNTFNPELNDGNFTLVRTYADPKWYFNSGATVTSKDPINTDAIVFDSGYYEVQYTNGQLFTLTHPGATTTLTAYPTNTNRSFVASGSITAGNATKYKGYVVPSGGYVDSIASIVEDTDTIAFTADFSGTSGNTTFGFDAINASQTYALYVDSVLVDTAVSDSNGYVELDGLIESASADVEVSWYSDEGEPLSISDALPSTDPTTTIGQSQTFSINTSSTANVTWYLDSIEQQTNTSVTFAEITLNGDTAGEYNVTAIASDGVTEVSQEWTWTVTETPVTQPEESTLMDLTIEQISNAIIIGGLIPLVIMAALIMGLLDGTKVDPLQAVIVMVVISFILVLTIVIINPLTIL